MTQFMKSLIASIAAVLAFLGLFSPSEYDKPIDPSNGGDPFIVEADGEFYYTHTTGGGIDIKQIEGLDNATVKKAKTVSGQVNTAQRVTSGLPKFIKLTTDGISFPVRFLMKMQCLRAQCLRVKILTLLQTTTAIPLY